MPDISPNIGGLVLEVLGESFGGGSDYRCRFGSTGYVPATYDAESSSILCTTPAGLLGYVPIHVSLNGQQYSEANQLEGILTFYDPDSIDSLPAYGAGVAQVG